MKVLVAGATGVIGRQLLPALTAAGHEAVGLARTGGGSAAAAAGVEVITADALDSAAVDRAVATAKPDAVVNMLTAIPSKIDPKRLAQDFALTNRLRIEGTRNLVNAAERAGVRQVISQGLAYAYDPVGDGAADEDAPLWRKPPRPFVPVLEALRELEHITREAGGTVLRFGHLYGPGTIYAREGTFIHQVKSGKLPLVGGGTATFSFTHTRDAAAATVAALGHGPAGVLNIVDDDPAEMNVWLPFLANVLDAPAPKAVPTFLARLATGPWGVAFMTRLRGADNSRAENVLGWTPSYPSWRTGFTTELSGSAASASAG